MKRLWTGNTVREEAILFASIRVRLSGFSASDAIESACDDWEKSAAGSIRHEIGRYILGLSDAAWKRLCLDVTKASRRGC